MVGNASPSAIQRLRHHKARLHLLGCKVAVAEPVLNSADSTLRHVAAREIPVAVILAVQFLPPHRASNRHQGFLCLRQKRSPSAEVEAGPHVNQYVRRTISSFTFFRFIPKARHMPRFYFA